MTPRITLHLVRRGAGAGEPPPGVVAAHDWVVYASADPPGPPLALAAHGAPPLPPGPIDHDQLVQLSLAAARVVTW